MTSASLRPLRPHQQVAIDMLRQSIGSGHRCPMLSLATGAGKTRIAAEIVHGGRAKRKRLAFSVPSLSLIDQTFDRFVLDGVDPADMGVIQGDHEWRRPHAPIQICSAQTLARRGWPDVDIVVVDEAHVRFDVYDRWMTECGYGPKPMPDEERSKLERTRRPIFIGLSATPGAKGLGQWYDDLIMPTTMADLIEAGYLSKFRVFAPTHPDLTGVKTVAGDYNEAQLGERMSKAKLVADVVDTWLTKAKGLRTLCFCVTRAHAQAVAEKFEAAGVRTAYVDANTPREERDAIGKRLDARELDVVANIGCLCLDEETEILTSAGFVGIDEMTYDHRIAAWHPDGIEFTHPKYIVRRDRENNEDMVSVEGKVHNIRVTGNHRMLWSTYPWGFQVKPAIELVGKRGYVPVSGEAAPATFEILTEHGEHTTKRINALAYKYRKQGLEPGTARLMAVDHIEHKAEHCALKNPADLTVDECQFIGFWLGDGTKGSNCYSAAQSTVNQGIIDWFDGVVSRLSLHHTKSNYEGKGNASDSVRWNFSTGRGGREQRVVGGIAHLSDYLNKNGTQLYWGLNKEQFKALLHGYWMADGNHGKSGDGAGAGRQIVGQSRELLELLQAIGACRGLRIGFKVRRRYENGDPSLYAISIMEQDSACLVRERLQVEKEWRPERVWCVTSTTSYLITRRKGKVTVVGNTTGIDWKVDCISLCRPTKSRMLFVQIVGRGLRTDEGKDHCLILDHSDTHLRLGMVTDIVFDQLDDGKPKKKSAGDSDQEERIPLPTECHECAGLIPARMKECPCCGAVKRRPHGVEEQAGELTELVPGQKRKVDKRPVRERLKDMGGYTIMAQLRQIQIEREKSDSWVFAQFRSLFDRWPFGAEKDAGPSDPTYELVSWIKARGIAYRKAMEAKRSAGEVVL